MKSKNRLAEPIALSSIALVISLLVSVQVCAQDTSTTPSNPAAGLRVGLLLSQVSLLGDPGENGANSLGFGLEGSYRIEPQLSLSSRYTISSHPAVDHKSFTAGADYHFNELESTYPYLSAGVAFLSNSFKSSGNRGESFGLYAGLGTDFNIAPNFWLGPEFRYTKSFGSRDNVAGRSIKTTDDTYSISIKAAYAF